MKKIIATSLAIVLFLVGCHMSTKNITLNAKVTAVSESSILLDTIDYKDFDKASVGITNKTKILDEKDEAININDLKENDELELIILPEVRESYPVQVTAVKVKRVKQSEVTDMVSQYQKITPKQAKEIMDIEDVVVLDVREQNEYNTGHIKNSILIPVNEMKTKAPELLKDKQKKILVYCRSGRRSAAASEQLAKMGYTNVLDFGGINDWPYETVR